MNAVADVTYIRLPTGFCYLAAILDAFSRRCVGWQLSKDIDTRLCLGALDKALSERGQLVGLVHHSDRGVQYTSAEYIQRLMGAEILPSMSAKGNPYDNAAERDVPAAKPKLYSRRSSVFMSKNSGRRCI